MEKKLVTLVPDGQRSVYLKRKGGPITSPQFGSIWEYRIICGVPNCPGEMCALPDDEMQGVGIATVHQIHRVTRLVVPPMYVLRDGTDGPKDVIEHIHRSRPRAPSMHSPDIRALTVAIHGSGHHPDGFPRLEFADFINGVDGRRQYFDYIILEENLPKGFRCPGCGEISWIYKEAMPLTRIEKTV